MQLIEKSSDKRLPLDTVFSVYLPCYLPLQHRLVELVGATTFLVDALLILCVLITSVYSIFIDAILVQY